MLGYGNPKNIIRELSEEGKHLLRRYYSSGFFEKSEEFQFLLEQLRWTWGLTYIDKSEDKLIIEYLKQKKEIDRIKNDFKYTLIDTLAMMNDLASYAIKDENYIKHNKEMQSIEMGKKMYEYIIDHPSEEIIFKILKERTVDRCYSVTGIRQERVSCYIFKLNY